MKFLHSNWFPAIIFIVVILVVLNETTNTGTTERTYFTPVAAVAKKTWQAPDITALGDDSASQIIQYGRQLIAHTANYFGPGGSIASITNGMNCQNCHIEAGSKPFGNCFSAVAANYPTFRPRSGKVESIEFRINDCLLRSLNGKTIDSLSKEMRAMVAYLKWLGKDVPHGTKPPGAGVQELSFMKRAADPAKGKTIYVSQCSRCHGTNGQGQASFDSIGYTYPPLWGSHSYNTGAGLYRLSKLAAYVKDNMPFGTTTHESPQLSDDEAWDVAAFVNSQPRPVKMFSHDWPDIAKKSFDYPYGPYTDSFSEQQHKYGPFEPIVKAKDLLAHQKK